MNHTLRRYLAGVSLAAALALVVAGCDLGVPTPTPAAPGPTATTSGAQPTVTTGSTQATATTSGETLPTPDVADPGITPVVRAAIRFADYNLEPTNVNPSLAPYTVEQGLANVENADDFELSDAARTLIEQNAFAAQFPAGEQYKQFYQLYEDGRYSEKPVFVTTDSLLHVYHLMFDKVLRTTETKYLITELNLLNAAMLGETQEQYNELKGTAAEDAAKRNLAYFAVASRLLDPSAPIPPEVEAEVTQELKNIDEHAGIIPSAVMNIGEEDPDNPFREDFGQYKPRGHYTRSPELEKYFRAMMWYGRMTFRLKSPSETQSALLLVDALQDATTAADRPAADVWATIYEPTAFFVGGADDLTFRDYAPLAAQVYGESPDLADYADSAKLEQFRKAAESLAGPRVNSMFVYITEDKEQVTKGLRMMGQRFTLDAYIFGQLIWREVGTLDPDPSKQRWLPKGLDIPAALGSDEAYKVLDEMGEVNCPERCLHYPEQMEKVRGQIASLPSSQWTENLYWSWLHTFRPLLSTKAPDSGYPSFMTNAAWTRKNLNTVLGSWTELKHDTILYAKQVMAEAGGGPPEPARGYVEPEPEFYARVAALVGMTRDGLVARGLLDTPQGEEVPADYRALQDLEDLALDLKHISEKELDGKELTEDEYNLIKYYGARLERITAAAADPADESQAGSTDLNDQDAAVVADVASAPGVALEEGTGRIMEVYVVFPIGGKLHIGRGGIYSQYEFEQPTSDRLTDEQWRQRLDQGQVPPIGDWKTYIAK